MSLSWAVLGFLAVVPGSGRDARPIAAAFLPALRPALVIAALVTVGLVVLWIPVLWDRLTAYLSRNAPKYAPRMILFGSGILVIGVVTRLVLLDVVGASMIGLLALGWIYDNY